jgi:RNA methyltransferase, TrmH family
VRAVEKVYGLEAVRALFEKRPEDVQRIAHGASVRLEVRELLREAAARRIAYEERTAEDLDRIAESTHHEGICVAAKPRPVRSLEALCSGLSSGKVRSVVAIDGVGNPHNIGAIVRSAAFFGVDAVLVASPEDKPVITPAAVRVAQGGAEHVSWVRCNALAPALSWLVSDARVSIVGTDVRAMSTLSELRWPARAVIVLGSERAGASEAVLAVSTHRVRIAGSGHVESLNVAVAAGVMLASWAGA